MYDVAIHLDYRAMQADGIELWRLPQCYDRGVILTQGQGGFIATSYFSRVVNTRTGEVIPRATYLDGTSLRENGGRGRFEMLMCVLFFVCVCGC